MPFNESDNQGQNNDPWNKRGKDNNDLDAVVANIARKLAQQLGLNGGSDASGGLPPHRHYGFLFIPLVLFVIWVLFGFYIVNPAENAVVLRLGKYSDTTTPGLHWLMPLIDEKRLVNIQVIHAFSLDGDFLTKSSDQNDLPDAAITLAPAEKNADLNDQSKNLVNVELNVQYRISDPRAFLFNVVDPNQTIQQVAAGSLSSIIGQMKLDDVLTTGREFLSSKVFEATRSVLATYNTGIEVVAVTLKKAQAPDQVKAAFNDVNRADQDQATYIQQAQAYASKIIPLAEGMAARTIADATGYQQKIVLHAQANIAKFEALSRVYATSPEITRERMYIETIQHILTHSTKVLVDLNAGNQLIYLPLDKLMSRKASNNSQKGG